MKVGEQVYVQVKLLSGEDRNDMCLVGIPQFSNFEKEVLCSSFYISEGKIDFDTIMRMLDFHYKEMISETTDYSQREIITKVYKEFISIIRSYQ